MIRAEHLQWSKDRAIEILDTDNDSIGAYTSFVTDLGKHEELRNHISIELGMMLLVSGNLSNTEQVKDFINGTN